MIIPHDLNSANHLLERPRDSLRVNNWAVGQFIKRSEENRYIHKVSCLLKYESVTPQIKRLVKQLLQSLLINITVLSVYFGTL